MTKEGSAAVASVLILLVVFACARLDTTGSFAFRRAHPTPDLTSAPSLTNGEARPVGGAETCELSQEP